jgi:hypothetical protein
MTTTTDLPTLFAAAWAQFTEALPRYPGNLTGNSSDAQVADYMAVLRAAADFDRITAARTEQGRHAGEQPSHISDVLYVADPPTINRDAAVFEVEWSQFDAFIKEWARLRLRPDFERWSVLASSGWTVSLVPAGGLPEREEHAERWHAANNTMHAMGGSRAFDNEMMGNRLANVTATAHKQQMERLAQARADQVVRDAQTAAGRAELDARERLVNAARR